MTLLLTISGAAQELSLHLDPQKALTQYHLDRWNTTEGLPQGSVKAIYQTSDGYLWLGTQEGLVRFDGLRFRLYDRSNSALPSSHVTALGEDGQGHLWVGTLGGGLARYEQGRFVVYGAKSGLPGRHVSALARDHAGRLWAGTTDGGLARWTGQGFVAYGTAHGLPGADVSALYIDVEGALWVGLRAGGLVRAVLSADGTPRFTPFPALAGQHVTSLAGTRTGTLWAGTEQGALYRLKDGKVTRRYTAADGLPAGGVLALVVDPQQTLWVGLNHGGLARFHNGRFDGLSTSLGLSHDVVKSLYADAEGSLWIGTDGGGLNRLRDGKFTTYTHREGLAHDYVVSVLESRDGTLWAGTEGGGLSRLRDGTFTTLTTRDGLPSDIVYALAETPDGSLWAGTFGGGLARYRNGQFTTFTTRDGLPSDKIFGLYVDPAGTLWIATGQGLGRYRDGQFTTFTTRHGLTSGLITTMADDGAGGLWVGTYDGGLNLLRADTVAARFGLAHGLRSEAILSLYRDDAGSLWIGTMEGGLARLQSGNLTTYGTAEGLPSEKIFQILEGDHDQLWMTSNKGLFSVPKENLKALDRGLIDRLDVAHYDRGDGLRSQEFIGGIQPAGWKARDGRFWLPSSEGLVVFHPARLPINRYVPRIVLERVRADDDDVDLHAGVATVAAGARKFEFHYAGLSFLAPAEVTYAYRLEGVDHEWVEAGTRREAFYTNLPPGRYTFRVRARNSDGLWSATDAVMSFELRPFFYQTPWFYGLLFLLSVILWVGVHRLRVRHLQERQRALEAQVVARTRDLVLEKDRTEAALHEAEHQRALAEEARTIIEAQADQLRAMDKIKTRFFNNISHEFRTPLTLNIGPLENALTGMYGDFSAELRGQLSLMLRNARRLLRLINQLLDLSKLESDKYELRPQPGDLVPFLEGIVLSFTAFAERKQLALNFETTRERQPMSFDPEAMEKVFFNLLSNAVKFTPEGGAIDLEIYPDGAAGEETITVCVRDTGLGIPADQLPYIFDRFHQVDGTVSTLQEGTGIGLSLVKELVELHGGRIEAESTLGEGTRFTVTLPTHQPASGDGAASGPIPEPVHEYAAVSRGPLVEMAVFEDEEDSAPARPASASGADLPTLLIVDDNPDIRAYMISCLRGTYHLRTAVDGQDAVEQLRGDLPDLVISDVMMPRLDGYGLCQHIKQSPALWHLPVILLTAKASVDEKIEGLEAGADDYLAKPFNARELQARVDNLLMLRTHQQHLRQLNAALEDANDELRAAGELKSQFLRIAAHDLRGPLSGIMGYTEILRDELQMSEEQGDLFDRITGSAKRMVNLVNQILEAEALESGALEIKRTPLDLAALARESADRFADTAARKNQQVVFSATAGSSCQVLASREWLQEAIDNLVSNALKYSPPGKTVWIDVVSQEGTAHFSVRDEGPGIREEDRPLLFQKFQKLSARPTGGESSTGLGLSIVKQIIDAHEGRVWVESAPGAGSTFLFELATVPAGDAPELALPPYTVPSPPPQP